MYVIAYNVCMKEIKFYTTEQGKCYFKEWFNKIDNSYKQRVIKRLNQLEDGNYGDSKKLSADLSELRLNFGSGYRIYYTETETTIVLILCAGDKSSQSKDIEKAKQIIIEIKE